MNDWYLAGIIDGEGCVSGTITTNNSIGIKVSVVMLDPEPIDALYARFGGHRKYAERQGFSRTVHTWYITNGKAVEALEFIKNFCLIKSRAAIPALEIATSMRGGVRGPAILPALRLRRLNLLKEIKKIIGKSSISPEQEARFLDTKRNGALPVVNSDGKRFESQSDAAKEFNVTPSAIWHSVKDGTKCAGKHWQYV